MGLRVRADVVDLSGKRFGGVLVERLVERRVFPSGQTKLLWSVRCDCGEAFVAEGQRLRGGRVTSCARCRRAQPAVGEVLLADGRTISQVASACGVKHDTLYRRYRRGWEPARLDAPVGAGA